MNKNRQEIEDNDFLEKHKDEESDGFFVLDYLYFILGSLFERDYNENERDDILYDLKGMAAELKHLSAKYKKPAPKGASGARKSMSEIIEMIRESINSMLENLDSSENSPLDKAKEKLEQADLMATQLRLSIDQQRLELAEILSGINRGRFKEGEPIKEEERTSILLTDEEKS